MEYKTLVDKPPDYEKVRLGKEFLSMYIFLTHANKQKNNSSAPANDAIKIQDNQEVDIKNKNEIANTFNLITDYLTIKEQYIKILSKYIDIDDIKLDLDYLKEKPKKRYRTPKNKKTRKIVDKKSDDGIIGSSKSDVNLNSSIVDELKKIDEELSASIPLNENGLNKDDDAVTTCSNCGKLVPKTMLCLYCGSPILFHVPSIV